MSVGISWGDRVLSFLFVALPTCHVSAGKIGISPKLNSLTAAIWKEGSDKVIYWWVLVTVISTANQTGELSGMFLINTVIPCFLWGIRVSCYQTLLFPFPVPLAKAILLGSLNLVTGFRVSTLASTQSPDCWVEETLSHQRPGVNIRRRRKVLTSPLWAAGPWKQRRTMRGEAWRRQ